MELFSREKAAEYYVVAWVKDWRLRTYLDAIGFGNRPWEEAHELFPWLPEKTFLYHKNMRIKAWTGTAMRRIQDLLFDAPDNKARLKVAKRIEKWDASNPQTSIVDNRRSKEMIKDKQAYRAERQIYHASVKAMRGRHDWNTVK